MIFENKLEIVKFLLYGITRQINYKELRIIKMEMIL